MAIPLKDLFDKNHPFWKKNPELCPKCKRPLDAMEIQEAEIRNTMGWCDDCYYGELGEEIEKHPICSPRVRRG
jgi:hypothetical protein